MQMYDTSLKENQSQSIINTFESQKKETLEQISRTKGDITLLQRELASNPIYITLLQHKAYLSYLQQVVTGINQIQQNKISDKYVSPIVDPDVDMSPLQLPASRSQSPTNLDESATDTRSASTWRFSSNSRAVEKDTTKLQVASTSLKMKISGYNFKKNDYSSVKCSIGGKIFDVMNMFNSRVCASYGFGDCSNNNCNLFHVCVFCLTVGKRTDKFCTHCYKVSNKDCRLGLNCKDKLKCKDNHTIKHRFLFLLHPDKDFKSDNRNMMCVQTQNPCTKPNCNYAHSKREQVCYVCYMNHNGIRCTNFPLYYSYFDNPGPWLTGLYLNGLI